MRPSRRECAMTSPLPVLPLTQPRDLLRGGAGAGAGGGGSQGLRKTSCCETCLPATHLRGLGAEMGSRDGRVPPVCEQAEPLLGLPWLPGRRESRSRAAFPPCAGLTGPGSPVVRVLCCHGDL